jgi:hypothetical protein
VPTFSFKVGFVFVLLARWRREVLHFKFNEHSTAKWMAQQLVEAVADRDVPRYLVSDRDRVYGRAGKFQSHTGCNYLEKAIRRTSRPHSSSVAGRCRARVDAIVHCHR